MEKFDIKVGNVVKIKPKTTLINEGCADASLLALADSCLQVEEIVKLSDDFLGYRVYDTINHTPIRTLICDSDIHLVNGQEPTLVNTQDKLEESKRLLASAIHKYLLNKDYKALDSEVDIINSYLSNTEFNAYLDGDNGAIIVAIVEDDAEDFIFRVEMEI